MTDMQWVGLVLLIIDCLLIYALGHYDGARKYKRKRDGKGRFMA